MVLMNAGEMPVEIVPYDAAWPGLFEDERRKILDAIGPWLAGPVEHIGSTAVPGLAAKPVIDIMAGVASLDASRIGRMPNTGSANLLPPSARTTCTWFRSTALSGPAPSRFATICGFTRAPRRNIKN